MMKNNAGLRKQWYSNIDIQLLNTVHY